MTTAGLYETSGDWLYDIGLPGKSGIGGGIVAGLSRQGRTSARSRRRSTAAGNSVKGQLVGEISCPSDWAWTCSFRKPEA